MNFFRSRIVTLIALLSFISLPLLAVNPVINGQTIFSDSVPTISACGTSPTVATGGTSNGATITVGSASTNTLTGATIPVLQCTVTFATPFTNPPVIGLSTFQVGGANSIRVASLSTTVLIVYFTSDAAGSKFSFVAF